MATKYGKIKDSGSGDYILPETRSKVVYMDNDKTLQDAFSTLSVDGNVQDSAGNIQCTVPISTTDVTVDPVAPINASHLNGVPAANFAEKRYLYTIYQVSTTYSTWAQEEAGSYWGATFTVAGISANTPIWDWKAVGSGTYSVDLVIQENLGMIMSITPGDQSVYIKCSEKPTIDFVVAIRAFNIT